ncbi:MAG: hypothetical protein DRO11_01955 [Methanobacteriota archaeon]|nr:MAG: hypothetical protein DRO11_01955 [Euryarchaeota archaeon]
MVQYIPKSALKNIEIGEDTSEEEIETILDTLENKSFAIRFVRANVVGSAYHIQRHPLPMKPRLGLAEPENPEEANPPELPPERPGLRQALGGELLQPPVENPEETPRGKAGGIREALRKLLPPRSVTVYRIEAGIVQAVGG